MADDLELQNYLLDALNPPGLAYSKKVYLEVVNKVHKLRLQGKTIEDPEMSSLCQLSEQIHQVIRREKAREVQS